MYEIENVAAQAAPEASVQKGDQFPRRRVLRAVASEAGEEVHYATGWSFYFGFASRRRRGGENMKPVKPLLIQRTGK